MPPSVPPALQALKPTQSPKSASLEPRIHTGPESSTSPGSQIPDHYRSGTTYDLRVGFEMVAALLKEVHRRQGFPNRDTCGLTPAMAPPNRLAGKFENLPHTRKSTQAVGLFLVSKPSSDRLSTLAAQHTQQTLLKHPRCFRATTLTSSSEH